MSPGGALARRTIRTLLLWAVCFTPAWATLAVAPETFWQAFSVGCLQLAAGMFGLLVTALIWAPKDFFK